MIYLLFIFLLLLLSYYYDYKGKKKLKTEWLASVTFFLIILVGFRYHVGGDTIRYIEEYPIYPSFFKINNFNFDNSRFGPGYIILNTIPKIFSDNFVLFQLFHASIVNIIFVIFIYKYTKHVFLGIFLYFIILYSYFNTEILREALAVCTFMIGWKYFLTNKWLKYYICCLISLSFHTSSIITFLIPIFYLPVFRSYFQLNKKCILIVCGIVFIGFFISTYFFDYIRLLEISQLDQYADVYQNSKNGSARELTFFSYIAFAIRVLVFPIGSIYIIKRKYTIDTISKYLPQFEYIVCWFIYMSFLCLFIKILNRFNNYFLPYMIIIVADAFYSSFKYNSKKIRLTIFSWLFILIPYSYVFINYYFNEIAPGILYLHKYYPYESIFFKVHNEKKDFIFN